MNDREITRTLTPVTLSTRTEPDSVDLPPLEIVAESGSSDVAKIFVARTRRGDDESLVEFVDGLDRNHERPRAVGLRGDDGAPRH